MTTEGYSLEEVEQMHGINVANACRMLPIISSGISKEQRELFYCYDILKKELNRNHVSYFKAVLYSYKVTRGAWEICYWIRLNENSYMLQISTMPYYNGIHLAEGEHLLCAQVGQKVFSVSDDEANEADSFMRLFLKNKQSIVRDSAILTGMGLLSFFLACGLGFMLQIYFSSIHIFYRLLISCFMLMLFPGINLLVLQHVKHKYEQNLFETYSGFHSKLLLGIGIAINIFSQILFYFM